MDKKAADKKAARLRRGLRARYKIRELGVHRLCIHRTPSHIYAQIIMPAPGGDRTLAAASTLDPALRQTVKSTGDIAGQGNRRYPGRVRPLGFQISRSGQGSGRRRA